MLPTLGGSSKYEKVYVNILSKILSLIESPVVLFMINVDLRHKKISLINGKSPPTASIAGIIQ